MPTTPPSKVRRLLLSFNRKVVYFLDSEVGLVFLPFLSAPSSDTLVLLCPSDRRTAIPCAGRLLGKPPGSGGTAYTLKTAEEYAADTRTPVVNSKKYFKHKRLQVPIILMI